MSRSSINPTTWSLEFGFDQGVLTESPERFLHCSGQTAVDERGEPRHPGDMQAQLGLVLDNLAAVLGAAEMRYEDVVRLMIFTTDVEQLLEHHALIEERFPPGIRPASTLLGVAALAIPELLVEIQATAAR